MDYQMLLVELILAGFFAVACIRCAVPTTKNIQVHLRDLFRLPGRLERLRRSRWQWFSMVALLLVIRLQKGMPLVLELTVAAMLVIFLLLPVRTRPVVRVHAR